MPEKVELKQHFRIESARHLPHLPEGHPCKKMHGHSFRLTLVLSGPVHEKTGWFMDYHLISEKMRPLLQRLDHQVLNEIQGLENPTTENLCIWLFAEVKKILPELTRVSVSETPDTECSYPI
jgi:6-pyruvoyltetrahydropterin/6-carboxytetrahydropterin synthase